MRYWERILGQVGLIVFGVGTILVGLIHVLLISDAIFGSLGLAILAFFGVSAFAGLLFGMCGGFDDDDEETVETPKSTIATIQEFRKKL